MKKLIKLYSYPCLSPFVQPATAIRLSTPISLGKVLILCLTLLFSNLAMSQANALKHIYLGNFATSGLSKSQLDSSISKANFEALRLQNRRDTLTFDNGFQVVLLSANELLGRGVAITASTYLTALPVKYKKPVYHINTSGQISAAHEIVNSKYSGE